MESRAASRWNGNTKPVMRLWRAVAHGCAGMACRTLCAARALRTARRLTKLLWENLYGYIIRTRPSEWKGFHSHFAMICI